MNAEDKVNKILAEVELFLATTKLYPMAGGVTTTTERINMYADDFAKNPYSAENYNKVKVWMDSFPSEFEALVNEPGYADKWKNLTREEKEHFLLFDNSTYQILRKILPAEQIYTVDWHKILPEVSVKITKETLQDLGLPEEFLIPPNNRLEQLKLTKKLVSLGYNQQEAEYVFKKFDYEKSTYSTSLLNLTLKNKSLIEIDKILAGKDIDVSWHVRYDLNFFADQERKFQNKTKPKM